mgnify:CR=1 FL=1
MILFLKRINILLALILLSLALGIVKFKNNLPNQKISNFDVDAIVVLTGGKGERIIEGYNQIENSKVPVAVSLLIYSIPLTFFWHYLLTNY